MIVGRIIVLNVLKAEKTIDSKTLHVSHLLQVLSFVSHFETLATKKLVFSSPLPSYLAPCSRKREISELQVAAINLPPADRVDCFVSIRSPRVNSLSTDTTGVWVEKGRRRIFITPSERVFHGIRNRSRFASTDQSPESRNSAGFIIGGRGGVCGFSGCKSHRV